MKDKFSNDKFAKASKYMAPTKNSKRKSQNSPKGANVVNTNRSISRSGALRVDFSIKDGRLLGFKGSPKFNDPKTLAKIGKRCAHALKSR